jgi:tetratricopeptide (TPR) repeat protein
VLPFISGRFRFILAITAAPIIIRNLSVFIEDRKWSDFFSKKSVMAVAAICVIAYCAISFAKPGPLWARARFGFDFDYSQMPKGAIEYMDRKGIYGKMLNTFHFGQYITWTGYPKREVIIDARGHLPEDLLHKVPHATASNRIMDDLQERFGFESALVVLNDETPLFKHPGWSLVYWDDVSLLYLKKGGTYDRIARDDAYTHIKPEGGFGYFVENPGDPESIERELKRNIKETGSSRARIYLGLLYNSHGVFKKATEQLSLVGPEYPDLKYFSYIAMGDSYKGLGDTERSMRYYSKALSINKDPYILYRIAVMHRSAGDTDKAVKYFKEALAESGDMMNIYPPIIEAFESLGLMTEADAARKKYASHKAASDVDIHFSIARKAYFKKDYTTATNQLGLVLEKDPGNPEALTSLGYLYIQMGRPREALDYFGRALDSNPEEARAGIINLPHAHFGIALIYRQMGNTGRATEHLRAYLKVEPTGGYADQANALIEEMSKTSR